MPVWSLQSNGEQTLNTQLQIVLTCYEGKKPKWYLLGYQAKYSK